MSHRRYSPARLLASAARGKSDGSPADAALDAGAVLDADVKGIWLGVGVALASAAYLGYRWYCRRKALAKLRDSVVLVTGASSGIGRELARVLAVEVKVKQVVIVARSAAALSALATELNVEAGRQVVVAYTADGSDSVSVEALCDRVLARFGGVDVLVNCAGAGIFRELWRASRQEVLTSLDAPLLSAVFFSRGVLPTMLRRPDRDAAIVMVQSPASRTPFPGSTMYSMNRWALRGLAASLRADLHGTHIRVQEVICGETNSNYFTANAGSRERIPAISALFPQQTPADSARAVLRCILSRRALHCEPAPLRWTLALYERCPALVQFFVNITGWRVDMRDYPPLADAAPAPATAAVAAAPAAPAATAVATAPAAEALPAAAVGGAGTSA